jgi:hypothetical protein
MKNFLLKNRFCCLIILSFLFILLFFPGCSLPGNVYLCFSWVTDRDIPDLTFTCEAPNIPDDINDIGKGGYYYTSHGNFTVTYNYTDDTTMRTLSITLEQKTTILGKENAYYDFIISRDNAPVCYEVPQGF